MRKLIPLLGLTVLLANDCGSAAAGVKDISGTYLLVTINGENLPYTVHSTPGVPQADEAIEGAVIVLNPGGQFVLEVVITIGQGQGSSLTESGTWTLEQDGLRLAFQGTDTLTATIVGDRITISQGVTLLEITVTNDGDVLVFEKSLS